MKHDPQNHWLTVSECAALYDRSMRTIWHWVQNGTFQQFGASVIEVRHGRSRRWYVRQSLPIFPKTDDKL